MTQMFEEKVTYSTNDGIKLKMSVEFLTQSIEIQKSETRVFSLGIPDDETIEDAEKDMSLLTKNSVKDWEE